MLAIGNKIEIDRQQVLSNIGYCDDYEPSGRIASLVNEYIENYDNLIEPAYSYVISDIESVQGNRVTIEDSITFESEIISRLLNQCEKVAVFALTIGNHLGDMICHLAENGLVLQATVLDAIGSGAAEKLAVFVEDRIKKIAISQGLSTSRRFSPGYCDWDIGQQRMLFRALKGDTAGILLTERCLMIPQKSISGIIGLGNPDSNNENYNPCITCDKQGCSGRR
ncbi:vitamin B12 dependent-methionine synthase activation domain-containing protein [Chloroflexota bacterium]